MCIPNEGAIFQEGPALITMGLTGALVTPHGWGGGGGLQSTNI